MRDIKKSANLILEERLDIKPVYIQEFDDIFLLPF